MSDLIIGLVGQDYVLMAADTSQARSILMMKDDDDKILHLDDKKLLGASGPVGDKAQFCEYITRNIALYALRTGIPLSVHGAAHFTRGELAEFLRRSPYFVNLLLGGVDKDGPSLYFLDYLASSHKMDFACQGYAGYLVLSILDKYWKKGMTLDEGVQLMHLCIEQLKTRFVLNSSSFVIKVADKDGIRVLEPGNTIKKY